jgi:hypothetical protein
MLPRELEDVAPLPVGLFTRLSRVVEREYWGVDYKILRRMLSYHYRHLRNQRGGLDVKPNGSFVMNTSLLSKNSFLPVVLIFTPADRHAAKKLPYGPPMVTVYELPSPPPSLPHWPVWNSTMPLQHDASKVMEIAHNDLIEELQQMDTSKMQRVLEKSIKAVDERRQRSNSLALPCICASSIKWLLPLNLTSPSCHTPEVALVVTQFDDTFQVTDVWPLDYAYIYARVASTLQHTWLAHVGVRGEEVEEEEEEEDVESEKDSKPVKKQKTQNVCREFESSGRCRFGDKCWYLHKV